MTYPFINVAQIYLIEIPYMTASIYVFPAMVFEYSSEVISCIEYDQDMPAHIKVKVE